MKAQFEYTNVEHVLNEFCTDFIALLKEKLEADGHNVTGKLLNSLETDIRFSHDELAVFLESEDYLYWLDNGRQPDSKMPPQQAIEDWVRNKNIQPYPDKNGKLPTEKQLVYLIRRSIGERGTLEQFGYGGNGGKYTEQCVRELYARYRERFEQALFYDFNDYSKAVLDDINTMIKL